MFVRKKKNRSGTVSVVIADKSSGKFKELKTIGVSSDSDEIARLEIKARQWIDEYSGQLTLDFDENAQALQEVKSTIARIERTLQNMPQFILGHIYDRIGFGAIGDSETADMLTPRPGGIMTGTRQSRRISQVRPLTSLPHPRQELVTEG